MVYVSDDTETMALDLQRHRVLWEAPVGAGRAELHGQHLLVTRMSSGSTSLAVLDATTGSTRWRATRTTEVNWKSRGNIVHGVDRQVLTVLDLATGRGLRKAPAREACGFSAPLVFSPGAGDYVLSARDATTGAMRWKLPNVAYAEVLGDGLYAGTFPPQESDHRFFVALAPPTGQERWRQKRGGNFYSRSFHPYHEVPVRTWKDLLITCSSEASRCFLAARRLSDGKQVWQAWMGGFSTLGDHRDPLVIVDRTAGQPPNRVSCLDLATGQTKWEDVIAGFFPSVRSLGDYLVIYTRHSGQSGPMTLETYAVARESGAVQWRFPHPDDFPLWAMADPTGKDTWVYVLSEGRLWVWNLSGLQAFSSLPP